MSSKLKLVFTDNFVINLDEIKEYYTKNANVNYFQKLVNLVFQEITPLIQENPLIGRKIKSNFTLNLANKIRLTSIEKRFPNGLRELLFEHFVLLYLITEQQLVILAIKDQKTLGYHFKELWI